MTFSDYAKTAHVLLQRMPTRRYRQLAVLAALTIVASIAELLTISAALPFLAVLADPERLFTAPQISFAVDFLGAREPRDLIAPLCLIFAAAILISGCLRLALVWMQTRLSHLIGVDLAVDMLERTLHQPYRVHAARNSSRTITVINAKSVRLVTGFILPILQILSSFTLITIVLFTLISFFPVVALTLMAGLLTIYIMTGLFLRRPISRNGEIIAVEMPKSMQALQEGLGGIRDILLEGSQKLHIERFKQAIRRQRLATGSNTVMGIAPRYVLETVGILVLIVVAYSMANRSEGLQTALPILGAVALGAQRLLPVTQLAYNAWSQIKGADAVMAECLTYLTQTKPEDSAKNPEPLPFHDKIRFNGISMRYDGADRLALDDVNLCISRGSRIGIIGTTGSGKSTLADILMGLLEPDTGHMAVDDVIIDASNQRAWQRHIAHVPQTIFLTDASLAENIAFGEEPGHIDRERLHRVIEQAQLTATVADLPDGLDTKVGEQGIRLSGGQRQRIAIARALYREADVIIFDEATSALDSATEARVMEAIGSLDDTLTLVMIAHRLTTLRGCDRIIEVEAGRVLREGPPSKMLETSHRKSKSPLL